MKYGNTQLAIASRDRPSGSMGIVLVMSGIRSARSLRSCLRTLQRAILVVLYLRSLWAAACTTPARLFSSAVLAPHTPVVLTWSAVAALVGGFAGAVLASVANTAIVPLQDVLGLGSEARMNLPGTVSGNWRWRYKTSSLTREIRERLRALTLLYDR